MHSSTPQAWNISHQFAIKPKEYFNSLYAYVYRRYNQRRVCNFLLWNITKWFITNEWAPIFMTIKVRTQKSGRIWKQNASKLPPLSVWFYYYYVKIVVKQNSFYYVVALRYIYSPKVLSIGNFPRKCSINRVKL